MGVSNKFIDTPLLLVFCTLYFSGEFGSFDITQ